MVEDSLPRFKVRALPPIGRRAPGNTPTQLIRALSIMVCAGVAIVALGRLPSDMIARPVQQASFASTRG